MNLIYSLQTAHMGGRTQSAQTVMRELGITYQHATPQSIGDCWQFWNCENVPAPLPDYLRPFGIDPMEMVGYGLSRSDAEAIAEVMRKRSEEKP